MTGMTPTILRATLGRMLRRPARPRRPEPPWRVGERVVIVSCDRRTGRPERPGVEFGAVVTAVDDVHVTASVGTASYVFFTCDGWEDSPFTVTPWRLLHDGGWRF